MFSNIRSAAASVFGASPKQKRKATAPPEPPDGNRRVLRRRVVPEEVYHGRKGRSSAEGADADGGGSSDAGHPNSRGRASRRRGGRDVGDDETDPSTSKISAKPSSQVARSPWELEDVGLDIMHLLKHYIEASSPLDAANAALVSSRWREMMGPRPAVSSALERFALYEFSDTIYGHDEPIVGQESVGDACAAMRHLISLPTEEAKEWLAADPFGCVPKVERFNFVATLICVRDRLVRALALQVIAIARDCFDEETVSFLLCNVINYFANLDFENEESSTVQEVSERMRFIAELVDTFCIGYPSAVARRLFELLLEPEQVREWDLHHLVAPYASKALLLIIERKPKETARHVHLVRDLLTVTEHSWSEKRVLRLSPSEYEWSTGKDHIPAQVSILRSAGITLIATFGKSAKEYLPMVAELLRDQRVIAPGQGLPCSVRAFDERDMTISMLAVQILGSSFITPAMSRGFLPVVAAMLNDVDLNTRIAAVRTLGRLGGRGAEACVSDLVDRLDDTSSVAQCEAIGALVNLAPSAVQPYVELIGLRMWDTHPDVCASAVDAMGWFGRNGLAADVPPHHVDELVNLLEDEDDEVVRAVVPALKDLKDLLRQSHVEQILQYIADDDDELLVSMALRAIKLLGADFFVRRGAIEFLLREVEMSEFHPQLRSPTSDALNLFAGSFTDETFKTSILNRLKSIESIETAKVEDVIDIRPWTAATYALAAITRAGEADVKQHTAGQVVTLVARIFDWTYATPPDLGNAMSALGCPIIVSNAGPQLVNTLVKLLRDLPQVVFVNTGNSRAKKEKAKEARDMLKYVLDDLLPMVISRLEHQSSPRILNLMQNARRKEHSRLVRLIVLEVGAVIELAFKRGDVKIALIAMECLLGFRDIKDEDNRTSIVARTINIILPLLLGGSKLKGVRLVYSDDRIRINQVPRYMHILILNASVVTPEHVEDLIGSIKMPFSDALQLNGYKMRLVMRAIESMSERQAQPLVDKVVEKFAPWKSRTSTTKCWRAGIWMIRVLATCPPGCSASHADTFEKYMLTCLDKGGDLMKDELQRETLAWAMLLISDAKIADFKVSMGSQKSPEGAENAWVPRNVFRKKRRGDTIAPLVPLVVDKWLMNSSVLEERMARIVLHRLKPKALKQFSRHGAEDRRESPFERGEVDMDKLVERFLASFDPESDMDFDDEDEMRDVRSGLEGDCDCPNCIARRALHGGTRRICPPGFDFRINRLGEFIPNSELSDPDEDDWEGTSMDYDEYTYTDQVFLQYEGMYNN